MEMVTCCELGSDCLAALSRINAINMLALRQQNVQNILLLLFDLRCVGKGQNAFGCAGMVISTTIDVTQAAISGKFNFPSSI